MLLKENSQFISALSSSSSAASVPTVLLGVCGVYEKDRSLPPFSGDRISFRPWWGVSLQTVFAVLAFAFAGVFGLSTLSKYHYDADVWLAVVALAAGLVLVASIFRTRIVLDADAIELSSLLSVRRMRRSDVVGYRMCKPGRGRTYLALRSRDPQAATVDVDMAVLDDPRCKPWFNDMPDLASRDARERQAAIDNDLALGATVEERRARASKIRTAYGWMFGLGFGFIAVDWVYDKPSLWFYGLLLIYVVACLGVTFFGPPFLLFARKPNTQGDPSRLGVLNMFWFPALGCISGLGFIHLADANAWKLLLTGCVSAALAIVWLAAGGPKVFRNDDWKVGLITVGAVALCLYSLVVGLNAVADFSKPVLDRASVTDMTVRHGRSTSYHLDLAFAHGKDRELVPKALYDQLEIGKPACVAARPGLFHIAWSEIERC
jgi:hypothetical protein